jgi:hypothetical protein
MYLNSNDITNMISIIKKINFMDELVRLVYNINLITDTKYKIKYNMNDELYKKIIKIKQKYGIDKIFEMFAYVYSKKNNFN